MSHDPTTTPAPSEPAPSDNSPTTVRVPAEPADATALTIAQRGTEAARALHAAGVIDLDAGLALLGPALRGEAFDAAAAVRDLRSRKPALFASRSAAGAGVPRATMTAGADVAGPREALMRAAERAATTGDRNAVLSYQRLKREAAALGV